MGKLWTLLLVPALACAQTATTNAPAPARIVEIKVPVNNAAAIESQNAGLGGVTTLRAVLALPAGFDARRSWPVLLVTAPSGASRKVTCGWWSRPRRSSSASTSAPSS